MKIGIISEYSNQTVNYGNCLQTYALNSYIRTTYPFVTVNTLELKKSHKNVLLSRETLISWVLKKIISKISKFIFKPFLVCERKIDNKPYIEERRQAFINFAKENIILNNNKISYSDFLNQDYDVYIVGSDVVWRQFRYGINRIKFLDFNSDKTFKRISYAASFGTDWIPKENLFNVKRCLSKFNAISVREYSTVSFLADFGIKNVKHVLDPTLLITKDRWIQLENCPLPNINDKFVFVYLLSASLNQYTSISRFCKKKGFKTVVIPCSDGENDMESEFGDYKIWTCSPGNWLWLTHHAEYVISDSFHATVFSTIFENKFIVLDRLNSSIGNRLTDFLGIINQEDKLLAIENINEAENLKWDYRNINRILDKKRKESIEFLDRALFGNV